MRVKLSIALLCCLVSVADAQQTVRVPVFIADQNGAPILIKPNELKAEVNGQPVPASATALGTNHLMYLVLFDGSGRTRWRGGTSEQVAVATEFLAQVVNSSSDIGSLVNFADDVFLDVQKSRNPEAIAAKLERAGRGETRLYDAVSSASNWLTRQPIDPDYRKIIFLFCDGEDNGSKSHLEQVDETLQRDGIPVFAIAPASAESKKDGANLRQLARDSGGRAYFLPRDTKHVSFDSIKTDLATGYLVTLSVPSSDHGRVPINFQIPENRQLSVTAPPQFFVP